MRPLRPAVSPRRVPRPCPRRAPCRAVPQPDGRPSPGRDGRPRARRRGPTVTGPEGRYRADACPPGATRSPSTPPDSWSPASGTSPRRRRDLATSRWRRRRCASACSSRPRGPTPRLATLGVTTHVLDGAASPSRSRRSCSSCCSRSRVCGGPRRRARRCRGRSSCAAATRNFGRVLDGRRPRNEAGGAFDFGALRRSSSSGSKSCAARRAASTAPTPWPASSTS